MACGAAGRSHPPHPESRSACQAGAGCVMDGAGTLFWGVFFGAFGVGYFIYGRKQKRFVPLFCGIGLMVFPYFVSGTAPILLVGGALLALPFVFK